MLNPHIGQATQLDRSTHLSNPIFSSNQLTHISSVFQICYFTTDTHGSEVEKVETALLRVNVRRLGLGCYDALGSGFGLELLMKLGLG